MPGFVCSGVENDDLVGEVLGLAVDDDIGNGNVIDDVAAGSLAEGIVGFPDQGVFAVAIFHFVNLDGEGIAVFGHGDGRV